MKSLFLSFLAFIAILTVQATAQITWTSLNAPVQNVEGIAASNDGHIFAGTFAGLFRYSPAAGTWQKLSIPNNIARSVIITPQHQILVATGGLQIYKSEDNGDTWTKILDKNDGDQYRFWRLAQSQSGQLYAAASQYKGVLTSTNGGADWVELNDGLGPANRDVNDFKVDVKGRLLLSTEVNGLFWYDVSATTWKNYPIPRAGGLHSPVYNAVTHPNGNILASRSGGSFISQNNGATWTQFANGSGYLGLLADGKIILVGGTSAFYSSNGGLSWVDASAGMSAFDAIRNIYPAQNGDFYLATNSDVVKGSFTTSSVENFKNELSLSAFPDPFTDYVNIAFQLSAAEHIKVTIYNTLSEQIAVLADGYVEAGAQSFTWGASDFPPGTYFYEITIGKKRTYAKFLKF
ncbi:MAG TPA: T9SS type A sorting domain-containing protein [Patescibacteria group bacterium]|nr:T9SS type A sorting domain-containing protein [Patescibacteria group bacterium]